MISKDALIALGVDYNKGMTLCLNNEDFYFKMINKIFCYLILYISILMHIYNKGIM